MRTEAASASEARDRDGELRSGSSWTRRGSLPSSTRRAETARGRGFDHAPSLTVRWLSAVVTARQSSRIVRGRPLGHRGIRAHRKRLDNAREGAATGRLSTFVKACRQITARPTRQSGEGFRSTRSSPAVRGHHGEVRARRRALPPRWRTRRRQRRIDRPLPHDSVQLIHAPPSTQRNRFVESRRIPLLAWTAVTRLELAPLSCEPLMQVFRGQARRAVGSRRSEGLCRRSNDQRKAVVPSVAHHSLDQRHRCGHAGVKGGRLLCSRAWPSLASTM